MSSDEDYFKKLYKIIGSKDINKLNSFFGSSAAKIVIDSINKHLDFNNKVPGETLLFHAVWSQNYEAVDLLLAHGANPNLPILNNNNSPYNSPLIMAVIKNDLTMVQKLIGANADPNLSIGMSVPLIEAVRNQDISIIELLLSHKANPNKVIFSNSPILSAIISNRLDIVKLLVENGASINKYVASSPLIVSAMNNNRSEILEYLLEKGAGITFYKTYRGVFNINDMACVKVLLKHGIDLNDNKYLLERALENKNLEFVKFLYCNGANFFQLGEIPYLMLLRGPASRQSFEVATFLNEIGGNINSYLKNGNTVLHQELSFYGDRSASVKQLVNLGADPNLRNLKTKKLPLEQAIEKKNYALVRCLLENGADPNLLDVNYIVKQPFGIIKLLIEGGLDVSQELIDIVQRDSFLEITKDFIADTSLKFYSPENKLLELDTSAEALNDTAKMILSKVIDDHYFVYRLIDGKDVRIDDRDSYLKMLLIRFKTLGSPQKESNSVYDKAFLLMGNMPIQKFVSDKMVQYHAINMINDEILGLYHLYRNKIFSKDIIDHISGFVSYNKHLTNTPNKFFNENFVSYFFYLLDQGLIDYQSQKLLEDTKHIASSMFVSEVATSGDTAAIKTLIDGQSQVTSASLIVLDEESKNIDSYKYSPLVPIKKITNNIADFFEQIGVNKVVLDWLYYMTLKLFRYEQVCQMEQLLKKYDISMSWHKVVFDEKATRLVKFKLHPDKGGDTEDFKMFTELSAVMKARILYSHNQWLTKLNQGAKLAKDFSHTTNLGVEIIKFSQDPSLDFGKKILLSAAPLISSVSGSSHLSMFSTVAIVSNDIKENGAINAVLNVIVSSAIIGFSKVHPTIGVAISASVALYSIYNSANNLHELFSSDTDQVLNDYNQALVGVIENQVYNLPQLMQ